MAQALINAGWKTLGKAAHFGERLSDIHCRFQLPDWMAKFLWHVTYYLVAIELAKLGFIGKLISEGIKGILG